MSPPQSIRVSSPGRICLFGEHQDYLHLPVIPCAISLRLSISASRTAALVVHLRLPDIHDEISFAAEGDPAYRSKRDYLRSAYNVLRWEGLVFSMGLEGDVHGDIPINAGTSSSSAMVISWTNLLARMADTPRELAPEELARLAHRAEVLEFNEPGGMMDHLASAYGGVTFIRFHPGLSVRQLTPRTGTFVLGDSGEPKDTTTILARVKNRVLDIIRLLSQQYPGFSLHTVDTEELDRYLVPLPEDLRPLLQGTIRNRDITLQGCELLQQAELPSAAFGELLSEHQSVLRDVLKISTPKIDRMIDAALNAGATGGKINGSGGGGCMFVYAPDRPEAVAEAIERCGGKAYIVRVDDGSRVEESR